MVAAEPRLEDRIAEATLGLDTLWGGDVLNPSGMGRFIADSWFSDEPLPRAYTDPAAARLRKSGGVASKTLDREAVRAYLDVVDVPGAVSAVAGAARTLGGLRGKYLEGLAECYTVMWDLAQELLGQGRPVPWETCMHAALGAVPGSADPGPKRQLLIRHLAAAGYGGELLSAVDAWRGDRLVPTKSIAQLGAAFIAQLDALTVQHMVPYMPSELAQVPRANVKFLPLPNAWFSGSMNYLGRARTPDGKPLYDATYELNASLSISVPEFVQLVSHEVVPGHVTTFAYLQHLYVLGQVGFEASVPTMSTRQAVLSEGIANNAVLMAHGVREVEELPDRDLQIGVLLAMLQDDAKSQSSYLTWKEGAPQAEVAKVLRNDYLVSEERADKLSGPWGRHPLLGRMYLPAYRAGTESVMELRRKYPAEQVLPALFSARGLVDMVTLPALLAGEL
jgi:hypothetical protein